MVVTTDSILTALKNETYTLTTLTSEDFFKTRQPEKRRRYPSVELLEVKPQSSTATQEVDDFQREFRIRIFLRLRGGRTTAQDDEIDSLETLETEIFDVIDGLTLGDHKVVSEDRQWSREYANESIPPHIMSILNIRVRQITPVSETPDGQLVYDNSESEGDNKPGSDYTYTDVFDVDIDEGYDEFDEYSAGTKNPKRFAGGFRGTFIGHVKVKNTDLGSTDDKLNQMKTIRSNGEKPVVSFIYTNKDVDSPTATTITRNVKMTIDSITEMYRTNQLTVFRVLGNLLEPTTTS